MRLAKAVLTVSAIGSFGYAVGLIVVPDLLAGLGAGPSETAWVRYLIPIYLGLGLVTLDASRHPGNRRLAGWGVAVIWLGLAGAHLANMQLGDEPVTGSTVGLLVFDLLMGASLTAGLV